MQASRARLFKEYKEVQREKAVDSDIQLMCDESNIFKWTALIKGPSETPYKGGVFQRAFAVPEQYPLQPPQVRFLGKIFHPNVHFKTREICLDILKNAWSPAWTLQSVCWAIIALMGLIAHSIVIQPAAGKFSLLQAIFCVLVISGETSLCQGCIQGLQPCQRKGNQCFICNSEILRYGNKDDNWCTVDVTPYQYDALRIICSSEILFKE